MNVISDEELLLLLEENTSRNPEFSYGLYQRLDLDEIPEPESKAEMRFNKNDIPVLADNKVPRSIIASGLLTEL